MKYWLKITLTLVIGSLAALLSYLYLDKKLALVISSFEAKTAGSLLYEFLLFLTKYSSAFIILVFMTSLFLWEKEKREWLPVVWVSFLASLLLCYILKYSIIRERPIAAMKEIKPVVNETDPSFPSGHATGAFATLAVLDKEYPRFMIVWMIIAILIVFSRLYFGLHYLSDVLFGATIGYSISMTFVYLETKYRIFRRFKLF